MPSGADLKKMDDQAERVRTIMARATAWADEQEGGLFSDFLLEPEEKSLIGNVRSNTARANKWLTEERQWAERGTEPDGRSYSVDFYVSAGKIIANTFAAILGEAKQQDVLSLTVAASQRDGAELAGRAATAVGNVAKGVEDATKAIAAPWPLWVKLLGGAAAVGVVGLVAMRLVDKVPDLSAVVPGSSTT